MKATLSNYLWIPKAAVRGTPDEFASSWVHEIPLLSTKEGQMRQQQISALRDEIGDDIDLKDVSTDDKFVIRNWTSVGDKWWALCRGDTEKCVSLCHRLGLDIEDQRVDVPWEGWTKDLAMVMPPKDYQVQPFNDWLNAGGGIFHAAPAFGKTYLMIWLLMTVRQRSMVLVHTDALAEQFITRFRLGSPVDDGFSPLTNCLDVERDTGQQVIGRYRSPDDLYPVTVATWQSFISSTGREALRSISKSFGVVLGDECHVFAAPQAASVVNAFHARQRRGVSAIPARKDRMELALYDVLGPVTATGRTRQLPVTATMISTGVSYKGGRYPKQSEWSYILNALARSSTRTDIIYQWIEKDLEAGRRLLVVSERRNWCIDLVDRLKKDGIKASFVVGGLKAEQRNSIIDKMMNDDLRVIVATKVFKEGIDIPVLDTMYATSPMSNKPQLDNMLGRIRRPYEGKNEPVFRYFVDEGHGIIYGCARATHKHLIELGADVVLLSDGSLDNALSAGYATGTASTSAERVEMRRGTGLRRVARQSSSAVRTLFKDLESESKGKENYKKRMNGERK